MADTYNSTTYNSGDYYVKSGVFSHWFYLLSEGGSGTNDLSSDYVVYGIDIDCATEIIFEAEIDNFYGVDSYTEARTATIDAAEELNGVGSLEVMQVQNAWYAVGVGTEPDQISISGPSIVCTSNSTFTLHNRPPGTTVNWTRDTYHLDYVSGQGTDNYTVKARSSVYGTAWVQAAISGNCGNVTIRYNIDWVGKVLPLDIRLTDRTTGMPQYVFCLNQPNPVQAKHDYGNPHIDDWNWSVSNGYITYDNPYGDNSKATLRPLNTNFSVEIQAHNACGWSEWADVSGETINCGWWFFGMFPNPSDDYVDITATKNDRAENSSEYYEVKIYSSMKIAVYGTGKTKEPLLRINTKQFRNGIYFVHFIAGKETIVKQLAVNH